MQYKTPNTAFLYVIFWLSNLEHNGDINYFKSILFDKPWASNILFSIFVKFIIILNFFSGVNIFNRNLENGWRYVCIFSKLS